MKTTTSTTSRTPTEFLGSAAQSASDVIAEIRRRFERLDSGADEITASVTAMATVHKTVGAQHLAARPSLSRMESQCFDFLICR